MPDDVVLKAVKACREWECVHQFLPLPAKIKSLELPPPLLTIVCYTDAAWKSDLQSAGLAWIFVDHNGVEINKGSIYQENVSSALMAEALALCGDLLQASALEYTKI